MLVPGSASPLLFHAPAGGAATAGRSIRLNAPDSAYLSRTPASAGNRKTWTLSMWVKRCQATTGAALFFGGPTDSTYTRILFTPENIQLQSSDSSTLAINLTTSAVFRDFSSWYHFVFSVDTTQGTASNRVKLYVNGAQITTFSTSTYPSQNYDTHINRTEKHSIGAEDSSAIYYKLNGYLALVHLIDGQQLTPSSFGETSATTGRWEAKTYAGTYSGNSFFLDFLDNSAATATTLGKDSSGLGNNWVPNNLSVTAGSGNDSLRDHPTSAGTDSGVGGEVSGNYCTLNPLDKNANLTLSNGNLELQASASAIEGVKGTIAIPTSGKYYAEANITSWTASGYFEFGIAPRSASNSDWFGVTSGTGFTIEANGTTDTRLRLNGSNVTVTGAVTTGDVFKVAVDYANQKVWVGKNSVWYDSSGGTTGNPATGANATGTLSSTETYLPAALKYGTSNTVACNFGQRAFAYTAPSGFSPLVDTLLPTPTIALPNTVMNVVTGNFDTTKTWTVGFNPDLIWIKSRSNADGHVITDSVRGTNAQLQSNTTGAELTNTTAVTSFNSDGFTIGTYGLVSNTSTVAWCWDAGSSNATNTSGSITSTVRANISAGFSVVSYTGTGSSATVGHGLGVAPHFMIIKERTNSVQNWNVYHRSVGNTEALFLNLTNAKTETSAWDNTTPTSTVFTVGAQPGVNGSGQNIIAYCWTPVAGYSAFGSYTGNGSSTDGPYVHLGFRPAWVMFRNTTTGLWGIYDSKRDLSNPETNYLRANGADAEGTSTSDVVDFLSNGFKVRSAFGFVNGSTNTIIYAAFAEAPFPYARAR